MAGTENFKKDSENAKVESQQKRSRLDIMKQDLTNFEEKLQHAKKVSQSHQTPLINT